MNQNQELATELQLADALRAVLTAKELSTYAWCWSALEPSEDEDEADPEYSDKLRASLPHALNIIKRLGLLAHQLGSALDSTADTNRVLVERLSNISVELENAQQGFDLYTEPNGPAMLERALAHAQAYATGKEVGRG